jgi:hypothetical protein
MRGGRDYVSNLGRFSDRELTLGFTMEFRLTGSTRNVRTSKRRRFEANSLMDFGHL